MEPDDFIQNNGALETEHIFHMLSLEEVYTKIDIPEQKVMDEKYMEEPSSDIFLELETNEKSIDKTKQELLTFGSFVKHHKKNENIHGKIKEKFKHLNQELQDKHFHILPKKIKNELLAERQLQKAGAKKIKELELHKKPVMQIIISFLKPKEQLKIQLVGKDCYNEKVPEVLKIYLNRIIIKINGDISYFESFNCLKRQKYDNITTNMTQEQFNQLKGEIHLFEMLSSNEEDPKKNVIVKFDFNFISDIIKVTDKKLLYQFPIRKIYKNYQKKSFDSLQYFHAELENGKVVGKGKKLTINPSDSKESTIYIGDLENDQPNGQGLFKDASKKGKECVKIGQFINGKLSGIGVELLVNIKDDYHKDPREEIYPTLKHLGRWENGEKNGWALFKNSSGWNYRVGKFQNNKRPKLKDCINKSANHLIVNDINNELIEETINRETIDKIEETIRDTVGKKAGIHFILGTYRKDRNFSNT